MLVHVVGTIIIAVVGLFSTAAAPWVSGRVQRAGERQRVQLERGQRDLEERRVLLDLAAEAASTYVEAVSNAMARVAYTDAWDRAAFDKAIDPVLAAKAAAYRINRRLVIRLGRQSLVVTTFGLVLRRCDEDIVHAAEQLRPEGPARPVQDRFALLADDDPRKALRWEAYEGFLDAATELVGESEVP